MDRLTYNHHKILVVQTPDDPDEQLTANILVLVKMLLPRCRLWRLSTYGRAILNKKLLTDVHVYSLDTTTTCNHHLQPPLSTTQHNEPTSLIPET